MPSKADFYAAVTEAVRAISEQGYQSPEQVQFWADRIERAAADSLTPPHVLREALDRFLRATYIKQIEKGGILRQHPGVGRFTIEKVKPHLRAELDRRILASADLIRLNREAAIQKTLQRFSGWATSVPKGGSRVVDKPEVKEDIRKALTSLPFEERRVVIDQGHKLAADLSNILATDGRAIAAAWEHHHVTYPRPEHLARGGKIFLIRNSWAHEKGLIKPNGNGYTDQIERPGELVLCRCSYRYLYALRDLPQEFLTVKGKEALLAARAA